MNIFVSIASYCDDLLFFTLKDCVAKARDPAQLTFGVVDQREETQERQIKQLEFASRIRYVHIDKHQTYGVSWARNICFSLYDEEDFLLQIDSHVLFEKHWDETLLQQFQSLRKSSAKPIISTYPYAFTLTETGEPVYQKPDGKSVLILRPQPETAFKDDTPVLQFRARHKAAQAPAPGCHLAGSFIFTSGLFTQEVPYDPYLYFNGEEQSLAIRAYTRGWDIYHPVWIPLYHAYKKQDIAHATDHWDRSADAKRSIPSEHLRKRARSRLKRLLMGDGMKGSVYGLGDVRTLDEYIAFSGIDYKNKTIRPDHLS